MLELFKIQLHKDLQRIHQLTKMENKINAVLFIRKISGLLLFIAIIEQQQLRIVRNLPYPGF